MTPRTCAASSSLLTYGIRTNCGIQGPDDYLVNIHEARAEIILTGPSGRVVWIFMTSVYDVARFTTAAIELGIDTSMNPFPVPCPFPDVMTVSGAMAVSGAMTFQHKYQQEGFMWRIQQYVAQGVQNARRFQDCPGSGPGMLREVAGECLGRRPQLFSEEMHLRLYKASSQIWVRTSGGNSKNQHWVRQNYLHAVVPGLLGYLKDTGFGEALGAGLFAFEPGLRDVGGSAARVLFGRWWGMKTVAPAMLVAIGVVLKVGLVWAGGRLHRWLSMSQLGCVATLNWQPRHACLNLLRLWRRDKTLVLLPCRPGPNDRTTLCFNPGAGGSAVWTLGPTVRVRGRLRLVGFCYLAIAIVTMTTMLREVRGVGAAGPLSWTDPATGGGAASTLGLKAWPGICRFELAGALVIRQFMGEACDSLPGPAVLVTEGSSTL
ncbi:predicted protein [Chaetomium globosum CBS 148.51]|uniref:Uncharacterized protein n=1 Tax=Chaetomium globosum (strain ATCC 6205 / CBS 148.51 / DSM 1962 / NBRC 6347 / NRRL 1970) TaxID=306901 RepID=Q2H869_CHAGB|nr:uncharacterized protein CHGG_03585 [Chaetomium globosum CBS 148.51]EAQ91650.1 predicted protein [Chaetomium globosum CBS 148.51]